MRQIRVYTTGAFALTQNVLIFRDWYSFADYVKEENLQGRSVTVRHWEYFGDVACVRKQEKEGEWICHRCESLWFGELAKTDWRPDKCLGKNPCD